MQHPLHSNVRMKKAFFIFVILQLFICYSFTQSLDPSTFIISGRISGKSNHYLMIAKPIEGTTFHGFHERYAIPESGEFCISLDIDQEGFVKLEYQLSAYRGISIYLYMQQGDSCHIEIDPEAETDKFRITGSNEAGQYLYNSKRKGMNSRELSFGKTFHYSDSLSAVELADSIQVLQDNDIKCFRRLYNTSEIDTGFYAAIVNDFRYYYASITVEIIQNAYFGTSMPTDHPNHRSEFPEDYSELWQITFDSVSPTKDIAAYSTWFQTPGHYANNYMWYNGFYLPQKKGEFDEDKMNENLWDYLFEGYKTSFSGKNLEFSLAAYLWTNTFQRYDIEFIDLFEEFRRLFPGSKYQPFLKESDDRLRQFHKIANAPDESQSRIGEIPPIDLGKDFHDEIIFDDSVQLITSLKQAVAPYLGKVIYIDVWATWCGPCLIEFQFMPELKEFLLKNDVEMLYISIDKDAYHEKWKDFIKVYNLTGHHIRAGEQLINNINQITGNTAIPWYFIVDKDGKLVERQAYRPGMQQKLLDQIKKYCQ
jgi:thiol-disulfide isomerase/thioredoxin